MAILGVLLFHLKVPGFALGWTGVPLFFVLSGFLITRILLSSKSSPNFFSRFYIRRSLRIFPIYYIVVIVSFVLFSSVDPGQLRYLKYYATYSQTWPMLRTQFHCIWILGHTWSLAIEEQFYLIWPLVIFLTGRRAAFFVVASLMAVAPVIRGLVLSSHNVYLAFAWLPTEVDALSAGSLLAIVLHGGTVPLRYLKIAAFVTAVGLVSVLVLIFISGGQSKFWMPETWASQPQNIFFISALSVFFTGVVAASLVSPKWLRWLRHPVLVYIGRRSYGMYLYHPFVFWFADLPHTERIVSSQHLSWWRELEKPIPLWLLKMGITFGVACVSWTFIESPILRLKEKAEKMFVNRRGGDSIRKGELVES